MREGQNFRETFQGDGSFAKLAALRPLITRVKALNALCAGLGAAGKHWVHWDEAEEGTQPGAL